MKHIFAFCAGIILTYSCNSAKENMQSIIPLYNTKWLLKKIYSGGQEDAVTTKAFIRFDQEKGSAGGNGSCNSFGSSITINGNNVSFKNTFSTKMYCEQVQQIENKFLGSLEKITRYEIKNKSLFLYRGKELLLEFVVAEETKSTE
jgi:heat shock protein HslJ